MLQSTAPEKLVRQTKSIPELFLRRTAELPEKEAYRYPVGDDWRSMTYRQTGERVRAIAAGFLSLGLGRQDRIGILCSTRIEWILVDFGILCAGGAATTVYPSSTADECAYILSDSGSRYCVVEDAAQLAKLRSQKAQMAGLGRSS